MLYKVREQLTPARSVVSRKGHLELLAHLAKSDCLGRTGDFDCTAMDWFVMLRSRARRRSQPAQAGAPRSHLLELGMKPGPRDGRAAEKIYEKQLDGEIKTARKGSLWLRRSLTTEELTRTEEKTLSAFSSVLRETSSVVKPARLRALARGGTLRADAARSCRRNGGSGPPRYARADHGYADSARAHRIRHRVSCALPRAVTCRTSGVIDRWPGCPRR